MLLQELEEDDRDFSDLQQEATALQAQVCAALGLASPAEPIPLAYGVLLCTENMQQVACTHAEGFCVLQISSTSHCPIDE